MFDTLSDSDLVSLLEKIRYNNKYNKIDLFSPYDFQKQFYKAGNKHQRRFLMAANRLGKVIAKQWRCLIT
ncbi:hypothetical protein AB4331_05880 [Vibrio breoganii]